MPCNYAFFPTGTGTPAIFTLNEPRLVRVQKYTVFQSSPPKASFAVLAKPVLRRRRKDATIHSDAKHYCVTNS